MKTIYTTILLTLSVLATACSGSKSAETSGDCASITEMMKKDTCYHDQIVAMPVSEIDKVINTGQQMVDPMIRGAAVAEWIRLHNNEINQQKGQELCALLDGRDRSYCMRRLSSPHLRR